MSELLDKLFPERCYVRKTIFDTNAYGHQRAIGNHMCSLDREHTGKHKCNCCGEEWVK